MDRHAVAVAATCLTLRHFPGSGARRDLSLSLIERAGCGFLSVSSKKSAISVFVSVERLSGALLIIGLGAGGLLLAFFVCRSEVESLERKERKQGVAWRFLTSGYIERDVVWCSVFCIGFRRFVGGIFRYSIYWKGKHLSWGAS